MILGLGPLVANWMGPKLIGETFYKNGVVDFRGLFLLPCLAAIAAAIVLALFFRPPRKEQVAMAGEPMVAH
jgi:nucleoside H+ symporter